MINSTSIYIIANIFSALANFLLLPIYAKYLGPSEFGVVMTMLTFSSLFSILITLAIEQSIFKIYFDVMSNERSAFFGTILIFVIVFGLAIVLISFFFSRQLGYLYPSIAFSPYYILTIFLSYFSAIFTIIKIFHQVIQNQKTYLKLVIFQVLLGSLLTYLLIIRYFSIGYLIANIITLIISVLYGLYNSKNIIEYKFILHLFKRAVRFSIPMFPSLIASWVLSFSDRIFIDNFNTQHELGIFSLASRISSVVTLVCTAIFMSYTPIYYLRVKEQNNNLYRINKYIMLVILSLCLLVIIASNLLVVSFFGNEYQKSVQILQIICLSLYINNSTGIINLAYYNQNKTYVIAIVILFSSVISFVFNWIGIKKYGIEAAAFVSCITTFLNLSILILYAKNKFNLYFPFLIFCFSILFLLTLILFQFEGLIYVGFSLTVLLLFKFKLIRSEILNVVSSIRNR